MYFAKFFNLLYVFFKFFEFFLCTIVCFSKLSFVHSSGFLNWPSSLKVERGILTFVTTTTKFCSWKISLFASATAFTAVTVTVERYQLDKSLGSNPVVIAHCHQNSIFFHLPTMKEVINSHSYRQVCLNAIQLIDNWLVLNAEGITAQKIKFSIKNFFNKCDQIVIFTEEILNRKLQFLHNECSRKWWTFPFFSSERLV